MKAHTIIKKNQSKIVNVVFSKFQDVAKFYWIILLFIGFTHIHLSAQCNTTSSIIRNSSFDSYISIPYSWSEQVSNYVPGGPVLPLEYVVHDWTHGTMPEADPIHHLSAPSADYLHNNMEDYTPAGEPVHPWPDSPDGGGFIGMVKVIDNKYRSSSQYSFLKYSETVAQCVELPEGIYNVSFRVGSWSIPWGWDGIMSPFNGRFYVYGDVAPSCRFPIPRPGSLHWLENIDCVETRSDLVTLGSVLINTTLDQWNPDLVTMTLTVPPGGVRGIVLSLGCPELSDFPYIAANDITGGPFWTREIKGGNYVTIDGFSVCPDCNDVLLVMKDISNPGCPSNLEIDLKISNGGTAIPSGVPITFYDSDPRVAGAVKVFTYTGTPSLAANAIHNIADIDIGVCDLNSGYLYAVFGDNGNQTLPLDLSGSLSGAGYDDECSFTNNISGLKLKERCSQFGDIIKN